jgi:hypothetical protein
MTEPRNDDRSQARHEAAALLGVDIDHLSAADSLRIDMVSALRLVIDHEQASVLSGGSADLGKLNVAVQSLIALLPGRELPAPESQREDPRQVMWEIYRTMRARGELPLRGEISDEGLQAKITQLESENAQLRAALGDSTAITPREADITPPGELGVCHAGIRPGPDDPPRRSTRVIEGKAAAVTPAAPAWQDWLDAGGQAGAHYDRWADNRD